MRTNFLYQWVLVIEGGELCWPQFDPETGEERMWSPPVDPIEKIILEPFTRELAQKINDLGENDAIPDGAPPIILDVPPGMTPICRRKKSLERTTYYHCTICGANFHYDAEFPLKCPQCEAVNLWYCKNCKELKETQLWDGAEVRCPDCERAGHPFGLEKQIILEYCIYEALTTNYAIGVEGWVKVVVTEGGIHITPFGDEI